MGESVICLHALIAILTTLSFGDPKAIPLWTPPRIVAATKKTFFLPALVVVITYVSPP